MNKEGWVIGGIAVVAIAVFTGFILFSKNPTTTSSTSGSAVDMSVLIRDTSHKSTTDTKKVTLVEFGDYQCPACGAAYPGVKRIQSDYSSSVTVIFRNFPLSQHQNALVAAESAEAAAAQGKFWEMHDLLYDRQNQWGESTSALAMLESYAAELKLDTAKFNSDVTGNKYSAVINADVADANTLGVNATPTIYINGVQFTDNPTYDNLKAAITAKL